MIRLPLLVNPHVGTVACSIYSRGFAHVPPRKGADIKWGTRYNKPLVVLLMDRMSFAQQYLLCPHIGACHVTTIHAPANERISLPGKLSILQYLMHGSSSVVAAKTAQGWSENDRIVAIICFSAMARDPRGSV